VAPFTALVASFLVFLARSHALFPANVHARAGLTLGGRPVARLVPRTLLQVLFLAAVLAAGFAW
jgi:hypothetical protein